MEKKAGRGAEASFSRQITWVNILDNGVCHYRSEVPRQAIGGGRVYYDRSNVRQYNELPKDPEMSTVITSMPRYDFQRRDFEQWKSEGRKVIVDIDDWLPTLPKVPGCYDPPPHHLDNLKECCLSADAVTASTPHLAQASKYYWPMDPQQRMRVHVVPNAIDLQRFDIRPTERLSDLTTIGFTGSAQHSEAFDKWLPALCETLSTGKFALIACGLDVWSKFPSGLRKYILQMGVWLPPVDLAKMQMQADITIAPALDNLHYMVKSPLRILESWAARSAVLCDKECYGSSIENGVDGIIADHRYLSDQLEALRDEKARASLVRAGRTTLSARHSLQGSALKWKEAIHLASSPVDALTIT